MSQSFVTSFLTLSRKQSVSAHVRLTTYIPIDFCQGQGSQMEKVLKNTKTIQTSVVGLAQSQGGVVSL